VTKNAILRAIEYQPVAAAAAAAAATAAAPVKRKNNKIKGVREGDRKMND
jgi:hypothetical protein